MQANIESIATTGREAEAKVKNPALGDEAKAEAQAEIARSAGSTSSCSR